MADSTAELMLILKAKDLASRQVGRLGDSFDKATKKTHTFRGALMTLGKVGVFAVITAFVAAIGVIGKATQMAEEEEKGIKRLNAALKANVKGWDGNTESIEKLITKREALAFSDDEQRQSLGTLVVATKDVQKAQELQAIAMDVARLKSISLDDASKLLIKAQMGNTRALRELGIQLPKTATKQEILTAIQRKAAGQAAAYGKTSAAAHQRFNIALDNLMEDLGATFLPVLTRVADFLATKVIPAIRDVARKVGDWMARNKPLIAQIKTVLGGALRVLVDVLGRVFGAFTKVLGIIGDIVGGIGDLIQNIKNAIRWLERLIGATEKTKAAAPAFRGPAGPGPRVPGSQSGGWVGLHGPEIRRVGEHGPEYVTPNHRLGGVGGGAQTIILQISGQEVGRVVVPAVSRQMFYELQRAAPTLSRT